MRHLARRAVVILRIGEAVKALTAVESWIPRRLPGLHAPKERLKGTVDAQDDILQHLAMDCAVFGHGFLATRKRGLLLRVADGDTSHAVGFASFTKGGIVDMAAEQSIRVRSSIRACSRVGLSWYW